MIIAMTLVVFCITTVAQGVEESLAGWEQGVVGKYALVCLCSIRAGDTEKRVTFGVYLKILEQSTHGAFACIGIVFVDVQLT